MMMMIYAYEVKHEMQVNL